MTHPLPLSACPHCGETRFAKVMPYPWEKEGEPDLVWGYHVICDASGLDSFPRGCGATSGWAETPDEATLAWNRRDLALTALRANSGEGWQPIETAPKDGTEIDVWAVNEVGHGGMRIIGVKWDWMTDWDGTAYEGWTDMYPTRWGSKYHPTHWMPPVAAPAPEHQEADQ